MPPRIALRVIAVTSLLGMLFSGALVYQEFGGAVAAASCTALGPPGTILGFPPCVYGLVMYAAVFVVSLLGLAHRPGVPAPGGPAHRDPSRGPVEARR